MVEGEGCFLVLWLGVYMVLFGSQSAKKDKT